MRRLILTALLAALTLPASAAAATLDDLRAAGYTVAKASDCQAGSDEKGAPVWKTTWYVSGFGNSIYMSECDPNFQATVDNWADPALNYERRWQFEKPEQLAAAQAIAGKCYSIGRAAPATDSWRITALAVDVTVPGADLPTLAGTLPDKKSVDGSCTATVAITPTTDGSGAVTVPGAVEIKAVVAEAPLAVSPAVAQAQAEAEVSAVEVAELVDELDAGASEAESLRMANAILDAG